MPRHEKLDFNDLSTEQLLSTAVTEIEEPSLIPPGRWVMRCTAAKIRMPTERDEYRYAYFLVHQPVEAIEADAMLVEEGKWRGAAVFTTLRISTPRDFANANRVFGAHGISLEGRGPTSLVEVVKGTYVEANVGVHSYERKSGEGKETVTENQLSGFKPSEFREPVAA